MRVVDASPLIHLARVSLLELLRGSDQSIAVTVPAVVLDEVLRGAWHEPGGGMFEAAARDWLTVVPTPMPHPDISRAKIDAGEIAVLSIALVRLSRHPLFYTVACLHSQRSGCLEL